MAPAGGGGYWVDRACRGLAIAGGCLLLLGAALVTASVLRRWLTYTAIPGDFELVQMGLAVAVFAFLPLCQLRGTNIVVDSFTTRAPAWLQAGLDGLWALVYALVAGLVGWRMVAGTRDAFVSGTTTMVLALPIGWSMAVATTMAWWLALVALVAAARSLGRRTRRR
jgi:hypothetical protein